VLEHAAERAGAEAAAARGAADGLRGTVARQEAAISRLALLLMDRTRQPAGASS
jgi:hypothetical protein